MLQRTFKSTFKSTFKIVLNVCLVTLLATSAFAASEDFSQTYDLAADGRISLENINGDVVIEGWDQSKVQVSYVKKASSQEGLDRVEVMIDSSSTGIEISTEYKKGDGGWNSNGSVDFILRVPHGARIDAVELVNGDLVLGQLSGEVTVEVVNGDVEASGMSGRVEIDSVNGSTDVVFDRLGADQRIELSAVNGPVSVTLPADVDADLSAETVHGGIENDFGLTVDKGRYVGSSLRGTLGSGGARIELENVNGSIAVRHH